MYNVYIINACWATGNMVHNKLCMSFSIENCFKIYNMLQDWLFIWLSWQVHPVSQLSTFSRLIQDLVEQGQATTTKKSCSGWSRIQEDGACTRHCHSTGSTLATKCQADRCRVPVSPCQLITVWGSKCWNQALAVAQWVVARGHCIGWAHTWECAYPSPPTHTDFCCSASWAKACAPFDIWTPRTSRVSGSSAQICRDC